jgi:uncharacterized RDD family membrane protein YckC
VRAPALPHRAYAGIVSRISGLCVDFILLTLAGSIVRLLPELAWEQITHTAAPDWLRTFATITAAALPWGYFTVSWWVAGQTIGAMLVGITVRRNDGEELGLPHAAARAAIGLLLAPLWLVGLLAVLWDSRRRAWHDKVFRTEVRFTRAPG